MGTGYGYAVPRVYRERLLAFIRVYSWFRLVPLATCGPGQNKTLPGSSGSGKWGGRRPVRDYRHLALVYAHCLAITDRPKRTTTARTNPF